MHPWIKKEKMFGLVLLFDVSFQLLHFGGMTFWDQIIHAVCLILASTILIRLNFRRSVPAFLYLPGLLLIGFSLIQLIPLPAFLFPLIAPTKNHFLDFLAQWVPGVHASRALSFLPGYHRIRLAGWLLDYLFFLLLLTGPRFPRKVLLTWIGLISLTMSILVLISSNQGVPAYIKNYTGISGNGNQFAGFLVMCNAMLFGVVIWALSKWRKNHFHDAKALPFGSIALVCILFNTLALVQLQSRSGLILLILLAIVVPLWTVRGLTSLWKYPLGVVLTIALVSIIFWVPSRALTTEIHRHGFKMDGRMHLNRTGLSILEQGNFAGTGLGSTAGLLGARSESTHKIHQFTEFHNDWLQVLVELGIPGLCLLGMVAWWLFAILKNAFEVSHSSQRYYLMGVFTALMIFSILSFVSFPMRITGIRLFVIVLLTRGLRQALHTPVKSSDMKYPVVACLILISGFGVLNWQRVPLIFDKNPLIATAAKYGTIHMVPLFRANHLLQELMTPTPISVHTDGQNQLFQDARKHCLKALSQNPGSIRALNVLFTLDLFHDSKKINRKLFEHYKARAEALTDFVPGGSSDSELALFLLYQSFPSLLNSGERETLYRLQLKYK